MTPNDPGQPLDCASARRLIDAFLLDELPSGSGAALRRHLAGCAACTTEMGGATRLIQLLGSLPAPAPAPDLDQRVILAALADHRRRHEHRSWLADLRTQVLRGAMRTTGTLVLTIFTVALLGAAFVFAASQLVGPVFTGGATIAPEVTPTPAQTVAPTTSPRPASPTPGIVVVTPGPTEAPTPEPTPAAEPTPSPSPTPELTPSPTPSVEPSPSATAEPSPTPTPTPTEKPRRTPPPQASPSPSPTPSP